MYLFRSLGLGCVTYLPRVMPVLLTLLASPSSDESLKQFLFEHLRGLVVTVKVHIRKYLPDIMPIVYQHWDDEALLPKMLPLLEEVAHALHDEFRGYLQDLLPHCVAVLVDAERSGERGAASCRAGGGASR
jgi:FKBP12-rapamycin complex-associated protein